MMRESVGGVESIGVPDWPCGRSVHVAETSFRRGKPRRAWPIQAVPGGVVRPSLRTTPASGKPEPDAGEGSQRRDGRRLRATVVFRDKRPPGRAFRAPRHGAVPEVPYVRGRDDRAPGSAGFRQSERADRAPATELRPGAGRCIAKDMAPCRPERSARFSRRRAFGLLRRRVCLRGTRGVGRKAYPPGASTFITWAPRHATRFGGPFNRTTICCGVT